MLRRGDVHSYSGIRDAGDERGSPSADQQRRIDLINAAKGISIVAIPIGTDLLLPTSNLSRDIQAWGIYNSGCDYLNGRGYATVFWDYLLAQGKKVVGVAVDDTHWVRGNACKGWICVNGDTLSTEALLAQIALGKFYASQGPEFRQIYVEDGQIMVSVRQFSGLTSSRMLLSGKWFGQTLLH